MWNGNPRIHIIPVLNLAGISNKLSQIKKSETLNDISINIYTNNKGIVPIRLVDEKGANLLYVEDDNEGHFTLKNLFGLISLQFTKKEHKKYFCDRRNNNNNITYNMTYNIYIYIYI